MENATQAKELISLISDHNQSNIQAGNFDDVILSEKQKLEQILEFEEVISSIKGFEELVECVVERLTKVLNAQKCSIMLLDAEKKTLKVAGARGMKD